MQCHELRRLAPQADACGDYPSTLRALAGNSRRENDRAAFANLWTSIFDRGKGRPITQFKCASRLPPMRGCKQFQTSNWRRSVQKRSSCIRVPYFGVALQCLPGTELVLTLTSGMTSAIKNDRRLRLCEVTARIARVSFPHGLASQTQLRPASCVASRCGAINGRSSHRVKGSRRTLDPAKAVAMIGRQDS